MNLKIFSWNIYCHNKNFNGALRFIDQQEADVVCLQEVPVLIAGKLKRRRGSYVTEVKARHRGRKKIKTRNVIMSRFPIKEHGSFPFEKKEQRSIKSRVSNLHGPSEFHYVDIKTGKRKVRIFNSHLECNTSPRMRADQFKQIVKKSHKSKTNIYCGDFNTYGRWYINLLVGHISNYKLKDYSQSDRELFDKLFEKHKLSNVFYGNVTYPLFRLQLDHILVPDDTSVLSKKVFKSRYGSDHRPIMVEVEI